MNKNPPLVCICIPHYNNEKTIAETLNSLINQTYQNIIIKIFDNASTDDSMKILKDYESKYPNIHVFQNEVNIGGEANFTKCFENAEGDYTAVFHADDVYDIHMIEKEVDFLNQHSSCSAVATHANFIDEEGNIIGEHFVPQEISTQNSYIFDFISLFRISLKYGNIITCPSVMARTDIIKNKIKFWDFEQYKTSADFDVWLRLSQYGGFGFINEPLIHYRMSEASYSFKHNRLATEVFDMFLVFEKYLQKNEIKKHLTQKDFCNYYYQYNKACLSVNINRCLLNISGFTECKKHHFCLNRKYLKLSVLFLGFYIIKVMPLPSIIKQMILRKKVDGKWFQ